MIGDRIRQARLAAGLTQDEVIEALAESGKSITKAALSKYENRKSEPRQAVLLALAKALRVKPTYFLTEPEFEVEWLAFRKQAKLSKGQQEQIKAYVVDVLIGQTWLQTRLFPAQKPSFPRRIKAKSPIDAERAAERLRSAWGLGDSPIDSLIETVEDHGGYVVGYSLPGVAFDGLSGRVDRRPLVVVNMDTVTDRKRYNVAHELGHLQMNCAGLTSRDEESLAHRFAAALLVPADVARDELGARRRNLSLEELGVLKVKHGLSMQAWARRAKDLQIISENAYKQLCIRFSQLGYRKREPVEFEGHENPMKLFQMSLRALAEGIITPEQAERFCKGSAEEPMSVLERLGSVPRSPRQLLRLPRSERAKFLEVAAIKAAREYSRNRSLTDFEAFGKDDLHVEET